MMSILVASSLLFNAIWVVDAGPTNWGMNSCVLPTYPEKGGYVVTGMLETAPGERWPAFELVYTCQVGYTLVGAQVLVCIDGFWTDEVPTCERDTPVLVPKVEQPKNNSAKVVSKPEADESRCILPPYPANGTYEVAGEEDATPDQRLSIAKVVFSCLPGFNLTGSSTVTCKDGLWLEETPQCLGTETAASSVEAQLPKESNGEDKSITETSDSEGQCILPPYPKNGTYEVTDEEVFTPGQKRSDAEVVFSCVPGHDLVGKTSVVCKDGLWLDEMPHCEPAAPEPLPLKTQQPDESTL